MKKSQRVEKSLNNNELLDNLTNVFIQFVLKWIAQNLIKLLGPKIAGFLTGGPIGFFLTMGVTYVLGILMTKTVVGGMFLWFDWSTKSQLNAVEQALKDIYDYSEVHGQMDDETITHFEDNLSDAYYKLIEF